MSDLNQENPQPTLLSKFVTEILLSFENLSESCCSMLKKDELILHDDSFIPIAKITIIMVCFLFVCWVICFQSQNETNKLSPEEASILAAYFAQCSLERDPHHPSPATAEHTTSSQDK